MTIKERFQKTHRRYSLVTVISFLLVFILWIRVSFPPLGQPMKTEEMDAYSRLAHVVLSFNYGDGVWLPGFHFIMRLFSFIPDNGTYFNYRLGIYIFTLISSFLIHFIVLKITSKQILSLLAMAMYLYHPLTIQLSVLTLTEIVWIFFILLSSYILFFTNFKNNIFLGIFLYIISLTIRFESWFLLPFVMFYIWRYQKKNINLIILVVIFPVYWTLITSVRTGNFLPYIYSKYLFSTSEFCPLHWNIKNIIFEFSKQLSTYIFSKFTILIILLLGIFVKNKKIFYTAFITSYLFIVFIIETYVSFNENSSPRFFYYLVPVMAILVPSIANNFINNTKHKNYQKIIFFVFITMFVCLEYWTLNQNNYSNYPKTVQDIDQIITDMNISKINKVYLCLSDSDYRLTFAYRRKYDVVWCDENTSIDSKHGVLITTIKNLPLYISKKHWTDKKIFQQYILYTF